MMLYFAAVCGILVDVELDDLDLAVELAGDLLKRRRDHAAGSAPLGPEIDHHGLRRLEHLRLEIGIGNLVTPMGHLAFVSLGGPAPQRIET